MKLDADTIAMRAYNGITPTLEEAITLADAYHVLRLAQQPRPVGPRTVYDDEKVSGYDQR